MGANTPQVAAFDPSKMGWELIAHNQDHNLWRNISSGEELQEYRQVFNDQNEMNYEKDMFQFRYNSPNQVASKFYREDLQKDMCSTFYRGDLFLQRIPVRLNQINDIPYPDALHLYQQAFRGFAELHDKMGYFDIEQDYICVNQLGKVKTWCNSDLSLSFPEHRQDVTGVQGTEADMVRKTLHLLNSNVDHSSFPQNLAAVYNQYQPQTFRDAHGILEQYSARHKVAIPGQLDCVLEMRPEDIINNGRARVNRKSQYSTPSFGSPTMTTSVLAPNIVNSFAPQVVATGNVIQNSIPVNASVVTRQIAAPAIVGSIAPRVSAVPQPVQTTFVPPPAPLTTNTINPQPRLNALVSQAPPSIPVTTTSGPVATYYNNAPTVVPQKVQTTIQNVATAPRITYASPNSNMRASFLGEATVQRSITPQPSTATLSSLAKPATAVASTVGPRIQPAITYGDRNRVASQYTPAVNFNTTSARTFQQNTISVAQPATTFYDQTRRGTIIGGLSAFPTTPRVGSKQLIEGPRIQSTGSSSLIPFGNVSTVQQNRVAVNNRTTINTGIVSGQVLNTNQRVQGTGQILTTSGSSTNIPSAPVNISAAGTYKQAAEEMIRRISQRDNINTNTTFGIANPPPPSSSSAVGASLTYTATNGSLVGTHTSSFAKTPGFGTSSLPLNTAEGGYTPPEILGLMKSGSTSEFQNVAVTKSVTNNYSSSYVNSSSSYQDAGQYVTSSSRYEPATLYDYTPVVASDHTSAITPSYSSSTYEKYGSSGTAEYNYKYTSALESYSSTSNNYASYGSTSHNGTGQISGTGAGRGLSDIGGAQAMKYSMYEERSGLDIYGSPSALGGSPNAASRKADISNNGATFGYTENSYRYDSVTEPTSYEYTYKQTTTTTSDDQYKVDLDNDLMRDLQKLKSGQKLTGGGEGVAPTSSSMSFGTSY